jgi:lipopolysaccharide/colanic/teichoic acid biosynthesis glycosyltransferase
MLLKRFFDFFFALLFLILFSWLILLLCIIAFLDTKENGFFIQERIGQFGTKFDIYKIRTMRLPKESTRLYVSKTGKFIRKHKFDELPQLINILKGEMSFVGPRPDITGYYDLLDGENVKVLNLKPGLTCAASLKYFNEDELLEKHINPLEYNDKIIFPDKVKMNLDYYYRRSFWKDIVIIWKTLTH